MLTTLEERRRTALNKVETLKAERNAVSQQIAELKKRKEDAAGISRRCVASGEEIKRLDEEAQTAEDEFMQLLMAIPNIPDAGVPEGADAEDNVVVRTWGEPPRFDFTPKPHWELGDGAAICWTLSARRKSPRRASRSLSGRGRGWNAR